MSGWLAGLDAWDKAALAAVQSGLGGPWADRLMVLLSDERYMLPVLVGLGTWWFLKGGWTGRATVLGVALLLLLTDAVPAHLWRPLIARPRPYAVLEGARVFVDGAWRVVDLALMQSKADSFGLPSIHATNSMGLAAYVFLFRRGWGLGLAAVAVLVGLSRIYLGQHYPLDVLAGWCWGALAAATVAWVVRLALARLEGPTGGPAGPA